MYPYLKQNFFRIVLLGSLIGLGEVMVGSMQIPYRSVILSAITITLLTLARFFLAKPGTSLAIITVAVLYKINNIGFHTCTTNVFLCGPTALLLLGTAHEASHHIFRSISSRYARILMICGTTAVVAFSLFAVMNTYLLHVWSASRLIEYIFLKSVLAGAAAGGISSAGLFLSGKISSDRLAGINKMPVNWISGIVTVALWITGSF